MLPRCNLEQGLLDALHKAAAMKGEAPETFISKLDLILQGTTAPLNTVLTRTGAKVGLITSGGFRDVIETRRGMRQGSAYNILFHLTKRWCRAICAEG
jgi:N-methylhydantoinase A